MGIGFKGYLAGLGTAFLMLGCVGAKFPYRYYGLGEADFTKGTLLGPTPSDDVPFVSCAPLGISHFPCVVIKAEDFFKLKQDYLDLQLNLDSCQRGIK
jgi:hypothetical protein